MNNHKEIKVNTTAAPTEIGPLTQHALALELPGHKRHRLLVLIAIALDAGLERSAMDLARQMPELWLGRTGRLDVRKFDGLLDCLEREGYLRVTRGRNLYELTAGGETT
jgi:hypothetical protein